jgi:hypothetical protein
MGAEAPVFKFDKADFVFVWYGIGRGETPLLVVGDTRAEQIAVPVGNNGAVWHIEQGRRQTKYVPDKQDKANGDAYPVFHLAPFVFVEKIDKEFFCYI